MANIQVDLTGVSGSNFECLPVGKYEAAIFNVEYKEGKAAPYLAVTFKVQEGPHAGRQIFDNVSFSPKALFKLKNLLSVVMPEVDTNGKLAFDPDELIGKKCNIVVVKADDYNGEPQTKVAKIVAATAVVNAFSAPGAAPTTAGAMPDNTLPFLK